MSTMKPHEIVAELDKYVIGQEKAKRMVAVAIRNRWRRQQLPEELRDEVAPKNIIMMGPTGCGKTEIARRLAKLSGAPFVKVEATKFTEVGYVGRDVESMIRDLLNIAIHMVREEENERVKKAAGAAAESRLMDLLLPGSMGSEQHASTREKIRQQYKLGVLDNMEVEMEVTEQPGRQIDLFAIPGMEEMGSQMKGLFSKAFPPKQSRRKLKVKDAYKILLQEESEKLVDENTIIETAKKRTEQMGIVFIDEIDKIAAPMCPARACSATFCPLSKAVLSTPSTVSCTPTTSCSSRPGHSISASPVTLFPNCRAVSPCAWNWTLSDAMNSSASSRNPTMP